MALDSPFAEYLMIAWFLTAAMIATPTPHIDSGHLPSLRHSDLTTQSRATLADTTLAPPTLTEAMLKQIAPAYKVIDSLMQLKGLEAPGMAQTPAKVKELATSIEESDEMAAAVKHVGLTPLEYARIISALYASWGATSLSSRLPKEIAIALGSQKSSYATEENNAFVKANGKLLQTLGFAPPSTGLENLQIMVR